MNELQMKVIYYKKKLGLKNEDISAMTGLPTTTISRICSGKTSNPKLGTIRLLANAFGCTMDDLMGLEGGVEPYYLDRKTGELAQALKENKELKVLFDAAKDLSAEDLQAVTGMINMLKRN